MRQACAAIALCCLLLVQAADASKIIFQETLPAYSCVTQPVNFQSINFDYVVYISNLQLPNNCSADSVWVSRLFMSGSCISQRNNQGYGCSGSGATVPTSVSSGSSLITNASTCANAAAYAPGNSWLQMSSVDTAGNKPFDDASLCTYYSTGAFFFQNNCSSAVNVDLTLSYVAYYNSCSSSGSSLWWRIVLGTICGLSILLIIGSFFIRHRRRQQQAMPPAGVQMGAMPGTSGIYPPQQPLYSDQYPPAGAWGAPAPGQQQEPYSTQPASMQPYGGSGMVTGYPATGYPMYQADATSSGAGPSTSQPPSNPYKV